MKLKTHIILWTALILLIVGWVKASDWMSGSVQKPQKVNIAESPMPEPAQEREKERQKTEEKAKASMEPGRVVVLDTAKGKIEFVLWEKDCPRSATRIADMVKTGAYNGVTFPRVEHWVIQVDTPKEEAEPMGCEFADGLSNIIGAVGMARTQDRNSNTNIFYILKQPSTFLDYDYTVLGHVIKGMDVVNKMEPNDIINKATLRPSTDADAKLLKKVLEEAGSQSS